MPVETSELQASIDQMLESVTGVPVESEPAPVEPPAESAPAEPVAAPTEPVAAEPASTPAPVTPEPVASEPAPVATPAPAVDPRDEDINALKEHNAALLELFNRQEIAPAIAPVAGPAPTPAPAPAPVPTPAPVASGPIEFVKSDEEFQQALTTREGFNKLLTEVYARGKSDAIADTSGSVSDVVNSAVNIHLKAERFFQTNEDLRPYRAVIGMLTTNLLQLHPEWNDGNYDRLFAELPNATRTALKLRPASATPTPAPTVPPSNGTPALPRAGSSRGAAQPSPQSALDKDIKAMLDAVL